MATRKEIAKRLIEFKRIYSPKERRAGCPFRTLGGVVCENCRIIFPLLKKRAPIGTEGGHSCPCTVYAIPYIKQVVRKFIKKWR